MASAETWRGLIVAPENRCATYNRDDYPYPQSIEHEIVKTLGGRVYGPYTGRTFKSTDETDIEHIVAASEAHDSGLCLADAETRHAFAQDLLNLTLAAPEVNRCGKTDNKCHSKCGLDAAEWLPCVNTCWFAARVVKVKLKYKLTVDRAEAEALEAMLRGCESTEMTFKTRHSE